MSASETARRPKVVYFINAFDHGGAELGLAQMVEGGIFAGCNLKIVAIVRGTGGLEAKLAALGHEPTILIDRPRMRTLDLARARALFAGLLACERPDLLVLSLPQANLIGRSCAGRHRPPIVASFEHNTHLAKRIYEIGYRLTSQRVDWLFADSENTAQEASHRLYRCAPPKTTIVPLLALRGDPRPPRAASPALRPFHLVNAARLTPIKNQSAIIEALALLVARGRDVRLTLYGEGFERATYEALARKLNLERRVEFAGFVRNWTERPADLFVLSSRHEGLCMSVLQAMHAGIPVAAPLVGGLRDYAGPEVMTTLASTEPRAIADAVEIVMSKPTRIRDKAAAAAQMAERRYGEAAVGAAYRKINQLILAECAGSSR